MAGGSEAWRRRCRELLGCVMGLLQAELAVSFKPLRPERGQIDGSPQSKQSLVRADVARRLLAADVLLARLQRQHPASAAVAVHRLADKPARDLADMIFPAGEQAQVWPAVRPSDCRGTGPRPRRCRRRTGPAASAMPRLIGSKLTTNSAPLAWPPRPESRLLPGSRRSSDAGRQRRASRHRRLASDRRGRESRRASAATRCAAPGWRDTSVASCDIRGARSRRR